VGSFNMLSDSFRIERELLSVGSDHVICDKILLKEDDDEVF